MADGLRVTVDATRLLALMDRVGPSLDWHCRDVARETAKRIAAEAERRVQRATGVTAAGIHWELSRDEKGYVVLAYQAGVQPPVDIFLETGTRYMYPKPFWWASVLLENGPHLRRMEQRVQEVLGDLSR